MNDKVYVSRYRIMRILVFYDLPTGTVLQRKNMQKFHMFLLKNGFYMMQESVYGCLAKHYDYAKSIMNRIQKNVPPAGDVRCLLITEKQYSKIHIFIGKKSLQEKAASIEPILEI